MISREDLKTLLSQVPEAESPVLSVYLNVDQSQAVNLNRGFEAALKSLIQNSERQLSETQKKDFIRDAEIAASFVADYQPEGKSLVLFCDASRDFMWKKSLSVALDNRIQWNLRPYIRPLLEVRDEFERIGMVIADRANARLLTIFQGRIIYQKSTSAQSDVKKVDASGMDQMLSQPHFQRKADEHVRTHLRVVSQLCDRMVEEQRLERIILAGRPEVIGELKPLLSDRVKRSIIGMSNLPVDSPDAEILKETRTMIVSEERRREGESVRELLTEAAKNRLAVTGLEKTLDALHENRIKELVYSEGLHLQGSECRESGDLFTREVAECPFCGHETTPVEDLLEAILVKVVENGGTVEQVRGNIAERLGQEAGGSGAYLRL